MNSNGKWISELLAVLGVLAVSPAVWAQPVLPIDLKNHFAALVFDEGQGSLHCRPGFLRRRQTR